MRRGIFVALVPLLLLAHPAFADGNGAVKTDLFESSTFACQQPAISGADKGFVVFNLPGPPGGPHEKVMATVSLKKAQPNTTMVVFLDQHTTPGTPAPNPNACDVDATFTTNEVGNGTVHVEDQWAGTNFFQVVIRPLGSPPDYTTPVVFVD